MFCIGYGIYRRGHSSHNCFLCWWHADFRSWNAHVYLHISCVAFAAFHWIFCHFPLMRSDRMNGLWKHHFCQWVFFYPILSGKHFTVQTFQMYRLIINADCFYILPWCVNSKDSLISVYISMCYLIYLNQTYHIWVSSVICYIVWPRQIVSAFGTFIWEPAKIRNSHHFVSIFLSQLVLVLGSKTKIHLMKFTFSSCNFLALSYTMV